PDRQLTAHVPARDRDVRVAGDGARAGGADEAGEVVAVLQVRHPRGVVGGGQDGVQVVGGDGVVDGRPRLPGGRGALLQVVRVGEVPAGGLRQLEDLLGEERHLHVGVVDVELDQAGQVGGVVARGGGQVGVDVVLELHQQGGELGGEGVVELRQLGVVHDGRAAVAQHLHRVLQHGGDLRVGRRGLAPHADPPARQRVRVQGRQVVAVDERGGVTGGRVVRVHALDDRQHGRGVGDVAGDGSGGV